ncbi:hypothetical protein AB0E83_21875 [Streptomyces sp. NPDC035033]|uniref:hypothetical protein n=1 Tax=Streptomyces sp. NPDC035033 TaxID=3155368 RepID=UPI0033CFAAC1
MKKRALLLSSLGGALLAVGGTTGLAFYEAAHHDPVFCFCLHGREDAAHVAADARVLVAGTVRKVWTYRRPGGGGEREERVVRARLTVDARFKRDPDGDGFAPGSTIDVEQVAGWYDDAFWAPLAEGRRYTLAVSPRARTGESSYDADAVEETPDRAAGDARWRRAVAASEELPDPCAELERTHREEYGADDVLRDWLG